MESLWPVTSFGISTASARAILDKQAKFLRVITNNLVTATVRTGSMNARFPGFTKTLEYSFIIRSTVAGGYEYDAFSFSHSIELYPVTFVLAEELGAEFHIPLTKSKGYPDKDCHTVIADDYISTSQFIKQILHSETITQVVQSLIRMR